METERLKRFNDELSIADWFGTLYEMVSIHVLCIDVCLLGAHDIGYFTATTCAMQMPLTNCASHAPYSANFGYGSHAAEHTYPLLLNDQNCSHTVHGTALGLWVAHV